MSALRVVSIGPDFTHAPMYRMLNILRDMAPSYRARVVDALVILWSGGTESDVLRKHGRIVLREAVVIAGGSHA